MNTPSTSSLLPELNLALRLLISSNDNWDSLTPSLEVIARLSNSSTVTLVEVSRIDEVAVTLHGRIILTRVNGKFDAIRLDQNIDHRRGEPQTGWIDQLIRGRKIGGDTQILDPNWTALIAHYKLDYKTFLLFPLFIDGAFWGLLGIGHPAQGHRWPADQILAIETYATLLANLLARRNSEAALRQSRDQLAEREALLANLFNYSPLGVFYLNNRGIIFKANQRFCTIVGKPHDKIEGEEVFSLAHPDDVEAARQVIYHAITHQLPEAYFQKRYIHPDGQVVWARGSVTLLYDEAGQYHYAIAFVEDITEQTQAAQTVSSYQALLEATLEALPDLKLRVDAAGQVLDLYAAEAELLALNLREDQLINQHILEWVPTVAGQGLLFNLHKALQEQRLRGFEFVWPTPHLLRYYEARINPINHSEAIVVLRDLTSRKQAEALLQEKISELDVKNRKLLEYIDSNLQLENFAYIASHDLREPIRTMRAFAQMVQKRYGEQLDDTGRKYLDFIDQGAKQMHALIEDLLTYSRVNTDETIIEPINLPAMLANLEEMLASYIHEKQAQLIYRWLPAQINGSATKIQQLFQNLLVNAIKFGPPDATPRITIGARDLDTHWEFYIADNGVGIDMEFKEHIFMLFKKFHAHAEYQGTGIGLALCKKIVEQHGGQIWVNSQPGRGSTFYFTLVK